MKTYQQFLDVINSESEDIINLNKIILDNVHFTEDELESIGASESSSYYVNNINPFDISYNVHLNDIRLKSDENYIVSSFYFTQTLFSTHFIDFIRKFKHDNGELYLYLEDNNTINENQVINDIKYISTLMKKFEMTYTEILNLGDTLYLKFDDIKHILELHGFEILFEEKTLNSFKLLTKYISEPKYNISDVKLTNNIPHPQSTLFTIKNGNIFNWLKNQPNITEKKLIEYFVANTKYEKNYVRKILFQVNNDEHFFTQLFH